MSKNNKVTYKGDTQEPGDLTGSCWERDGSYYIMGDQVDCYYFPLTRLSDGITLTFGDPSEVAEEYRRCTKGTIEIHFYSNEELNRIMDILGITAE